VCVANCFVTDVAEKARRKREKFSFLFLSEGK
jgi:hypothetical protein